mmetsp:Transcript_68012/g.175311  ORF Transcript_68012/g.175311 Transcript_68012/m.175311 type:complete len:218 (-) Transcript_68012:318-971(-)
MHWPNHHRRPRILPACTGGRRLALSSSGSCLCRCLGRLRRGRPLSPSRMRDWAMLRSSMTAMAMGRPCCSSASASASSAQVPWTTGTAPVVNAPLCSLASRSCKYCRRRPFGTWRSSTDTVRVPSESSPLARVPTRDSGLSCTPVQCAGNLSSAFAMERRWLDCRNRSRSSVSSPGLPKKRQVVLPKSAVAAAGAISFSGILAKATLAGRSVRLAFT